LIGILLRATVIHEAAHAVTRFVLGRRIDRVSVIPGDDDLGHVLGRTLPQMIEFLEVAGRRR